MRHPPGVFPCLIVAPVELLKRRRHFEPSQAIRSHSLSLTFTTLIRELRTRTIFFKTESALICSREIGCFSGLSGAKSTADQSPSLAVLSGYASVTTLAMPTICLSETL